MMSTLRARMMLTVGLLAITAILAVALAARQGTRLQFRRYQELERFSGDARPSDAPQKVSAILDGKCCSAASIGSAAPLLGARELLLVMNEQGTVLAKAGKPLEEGRNFRFQRNGDELTVEGIDPQSSDIRSSLTLRFRLRGIPIKTEDGTPAALYILRIPEPSRERPENVFLGSLDRSLIWMTVLVALVVLIATWILTRRLASPLEELRSAARDLARGDFSRRVPARGSDEVADLARGFNAMAAELEHQQALRRNLVHDVVHELRTPLTALRCRLDTISDGLSRLPHREIAQADEEMEHLTRLVDDLQELALAEAGELKLSRSEVELVPVLLSAARAAGLENDSRVRMETVDGLMVTGDVVRLRQVVLNIMSNAARYTPFDGVITVRAFAREDQAVVEVYNTGSSLTNDDLAHVFDRFYRADESRQRATGGTGLGLAIVKNLVEAHHGQVWARSDSSGVTFGFAVPLRRDGKENRGSLARTS